MDNTDTLKTSLGLFDLGFSNEYLDKLSRNIQVTSDIKAVFSLVLESFVKGLPDTRRRRRTVGYYFRCVTYYKTWCGTNPEITPASDSVVLFIDASLL